MTFVITELLAKFDDAVRAKVAGPLASPRADRIVIWVTSLERVDEIMGALAAYQRTHRCFFKDGAPRLCREISSAGEHPLRGVGVANNVSGGGSFGESRITLILGVYRKLLKENPSWPTLRGEPAEQAKEVFVNEVVAALRRAGIDPKQVHR